MEKVVEFRRALNIVNLLCWVVIAVGFIGMIYTMLQMSGGSVSNLMLVGSWALTIFVVWLVKVLGLGIGYSICAIAENTYEGTYIEEQPHSFIKTSSVDEVETKIVSLEAGVQCSEDGCRVISHTLYGGEAKCAYHKPRG
ncbi:hypothetical protein AB4140_14150 [Shewanella sp. 10N.286.51.B2]|uniref:hypothetical protein n=1 Tax=Shewanella sp. 10N.286.51.B2 TaxID=3229707 RepID=UPI0035542995